jgi:hypothetical protein
MKPIPFNIWDDYYDDGYIPEGERQATHGYIEEYDTITDDDKEKMLQVVFNYINTLDMTGVEMEIEGTDLYFTHLTHERRERLVEELEKSNLQYNGRPFSFYSES